MLWCFAGRVSRCLKQGARILFGVSSPEHCVPGDKKVRTGLDDLGNRIVSHPAVHFNSKCQTQFGAKLGQPAESFREKTE